MCKCALKVCMIAEGVQVLAVDLKVLSTCLAVGELGDGGASIGDKNFSLSGTDSTSGALYLSTN